MANAIFSSTFRRAGLFALTLATCGWLLCLPANAQPITLDSVSTAGTQGNGESAKGSISADGRFVVFASNASTLVGSDENATYDVFVRDRHTEETERVSVVDGTGAEGNGQSFDPSISADGRFVAFTSAASNLVGGDTTPFQDVFVHDRWNDTTERVSIRTGGAPGNSSSFAASISADGRYVAFQSSASNLAAGGDTNDRPDIFVHDRDNNTTELVSITSAGATGNRQSENPAISADGSHVAFSSFASDLVPTDANTTIADVFVRDLQAGTTELISVGPVGVGATNGSFSPSISADGNYVAFGSNASNLVGAGTDGRSNIFVRDRQTGTTQRISVAIVSGQEANSTSNAPSISNDGRYVAFSSNATNLVAGADTNGSPDIFVRDRLAGSTARVSVDAAGAQANNQSLDPGISGDGRHVAFASFSNNLVTPDNNGQFDVFTRRLARLTLSASPAAGGSVSGGGTFPDGADRAITATANPGYTFNFWTDTGHVVSFDPSATIALDGDRSLVAQYRCDYLNGAELICPSKRLRPASNVHRHGHRDAWERLPHGRSPVQERRQQSRQPGAH